MSSLQKNDVAMECTSNTMATIISSQQRNTSFFEKIHNLLWNEAGLNPEKALENMVFFFAYRQLDPCVQKLGLPQRCSWKYLITIKDDELMLHLEIQKAVGDFRRNEVTKPFFNKHDITKATTVQKLVEAINENISDEMLNESDILGDVFEYMLGRGISTMADDGQYFTNRVICKKAFDYAYRVKGTIRRDDGSLCTFADFFCGTGGFVTEYIKGVNNITPNVDWEREQSQVYCLDKNMSSVTTTLMNCLIQTHLPFSSKRITDCNSFQDCITMGASPLFPGLQVDYMLTNPPYGGDKTKGKEYKFSYCKTVKTLIPGTNPDSKQKKKYMTNKIYNVNPEIQSIGIEDDDKVSAGVQLAMATISEDGGVAAMVLPQGFFTGVNEKPVALRKKIAEEYKIHYVVDIPSGAFANTSTKTSMIVFQRGVGATESIKFMDMDDNILVEASLDQLRAKKYNLNYKVYIETVLEDIEGFEWVRLGDVCHTKNGFAIKSANMTKDDKDYPVVKVKNLTGLSAKIVDDNDYINIKLSDTYQIKHGDVLIVMVGNTAGKMSIWQDDRVAYLNQNIHKLHFNNNVVPKYIFYLLNTKTYMNQILQLSSGTAQPFISPSRLYDIKIPLPSLERQAQIVEDIDKWASMAHAEENSLNILEQCIMNEVRFMARGKPRVRLGDIIEKKGSGKTKSGQITNTGEYPFYSCTALAPSGTNSVYDYDDAEYLLFAKSGGNAKTIYGNNLGIGKFHYLMGKSASSSDVIQFVLNEKTDCILKYIHIVLQQRLFDIQKMARYTTGLGHIDITELLDLKIPKPSLEEQQELQPYFDEVKHKHELIAHYKAKADAAIKKNIPGAATVDEPGSGTSSLDGASGSGSTLDPPAPALETSSAPPSVASSVSSTQSVKNLQAMCKSLGIKGYSKKTKSELIKMIGDH